MPDHPIVERPDAPISPAEPPPPRRIVVRSPNWLGDAVMALPALRDIRRHFPGAAMAVAAQAGLAAFFRLVPGVDEILPLQREDGTDRIWRSEDVARLAAGRFDTAILLTNSFQSAWHAYRARIPERWGYRRDFRGPLLTRAIARPPGRKGTRHHGLYYQDLVRAVGIETGPLEARLDVPAELNARAMALLAERACDASRDVVIGIAPGAAYGGAKRWPPERMASLIDHLTSEAGATCVLFGSGGDSATARAIESSLGGPDALRRRGIGTTGAGRVIDLVGQTDLETLIGLISCCRGFVSNDSGAMHLAAAVGVPVTAIFGPTRERATSPLGPHEIVTNPVWCRPCMLRECPIDHRCMKGIPVSRVLESVVRQLRRSVPDGPA